MKILVVEDEHRIAGYIKKGLELKAHVVDTAFDGEAGLDLATDAAYDVIVLDRMLPKLDGMSICKKLRRAGNHTPILMLTALSDIKERVEGLDSGADDYLPKPFAFSELLARVNALGRRPPTTTSSILTLGDLILDPHRYTVSRDHTAISLSKKEFTLLEFLLRHPNQVFTKDQLTQSVWPYDSDVLPNTAQVYIGYIRKKIDHAFPQLPPLIQTVRGFGYKLAYENHTA